MIHSRKTKKFISLLLAMIMAVSLFAVVVHAATAYECIKRTQLMQKNDITSAVLGYIEVRETFMCTGTVYSKVDGEQVPTWYSGYPDVGTNIYEDYGNQRVMGFALCECFKA